MYDFDASEKRGRKIMDADEKHVGMKLKEAFSKKKGKVIGTGFIKGNLSHMVMGYKGYKGESE